ncbi:rod shape-determining protein, partial [candidate division KSB1 bacterium]
KESSDILYFGLDLGTFQSALAASSGLRVNVGSVVGWPRDFISYKLLNKQIVFGDECLKNRPSLEVVYPLEKGVIKYRDAGLGEKPEGEKVASAAVELIRHLLSLAEAREDQKIYAVVGAPARASMDDKQAIISASEGLVDSILVVSEPFLVSYSLGIYGFAIIVDIGAGTLDICRMHGTIPDEEDQRTLYTAGNEIDKKFFELMKEKVSGIQLTSSLSRKIKEEYGFVGEGQDTVNVDFYVEGRLETIDIANEIKEACSIIVPEICDNIRELVVSFDPEYMGELTKNIILAGGCSQIKGLAHEIETNLSDLGSVRINVIDDPIYAGAVGGLMLAQEMPVEEWEQV